LLSLVDFVFLLAAAKSKIMATSCTRIAIPIKPLLEQLCHYLNLSAPIYHSHSSAMHNYYVIVHSENEPTAHIFFGGDYGTFDESAERVAKKMVLFFVKKNNIYVEDVNLEVREQAERASELFRERVRSDCIHTETERFGEAEFIAWLTIICSGKMVSVRCITGDKVVSMIEAKQSVARKAILFLLNEYAFKIEDVNFHFLEFVTFSFKLERESYLTIKERLYGVKENSTTTTVLQEEVLCTPHGVEFKILEFSVAPPPPKNRTMYCSARGFSDIIPTRVRPFELNRVLKRKKREKI
ncbi:4-hydroxyproline 2-epimerase, partial [Bienertia sinuspersici]